MSSDSPEGTTPARGGSIPPFPAQPALSVASAADLGAAFHASAIAQWVFDRETLRLLAVNRAAIRTYGYSEAEFLGLTILDIRPPEDHDHVMQAVEDGSPAPLELSAVWRHRWRSGEVRFVRVSTNPIQFAGRPAFLAQIFDITAEMRMEQALADARRRLDSALIAGEVGTFEWDVVSDRLWGDENFARLFDVTLDRGAAPLALYIAAIHRDDREAVMDRVRRTVQTGCDYEAEYRVVRPSDERWVIARGKAERDASGRVVRFPGVVLDVTDRRRAEEGLRESEERYRRLFTNMTEGFALGECLCDEDGVPRDFRFLEMNDAFERQSGLDREATRGRPMREVLPHLEQEWIDLYCGIALGGPPRRFESYNRDLGRHFSVYCFSPMRGQFATLFTDVTERKRAEEALRDSEERYRTLFESIEHGFCIVEVLLDGSGEPTDYRFLQANPAFAPATGLVNAMGRTALELIPGLERWWVETYGRVALTGEPVRFENYSAPMGRWFDVYAFRFGRPENRQVAIFFKNITEQKRAEEEREAMLAENARLFREAQAANDLKDQFLATLSHELRTPLNAVLGWLAVLKNPRLDPADRLRALETIERNARAQTQLIADILDVSAIAAGRLSLAKQDVRVATILEQVIETIRPTAEGKRLVVGVDDSARDALVSADPSRLQQIVWNLLSNAVKFTEREGRIEVRAAADAGEVSIAVQDDGIGIHADFLPHVFDRFRQADGTTTRAHSGMGLGLAIVRDLVQMHGGTIEVQSAGPNRGTTFVVRMPRVFPAPAASGEPDAAPHGPPLSVLVVDDHQDTRDMMELILSERGMRVVTASSADDAVAAYDAVPCDVALIDISMPGEDGYGCLRQLQAAAAQSARTLPAIALTAHAREQDRADALDAGFAAHVVKPVDVDALLATIRLVGSDPA